MKEVQEFSVGSMGD